MANKLTKKDLVEIVATELEMTKKDATEAVNTVFDQMATALKNGGEVDIAGFGKFVVKTRAARTGVVPGTDKKIEIAESKVPSFKASKTLKELVK